MALVAMSVFFAVASCDKYDYTDLRNAINELKSKVEALEAKVQENVSAIQSIVSLGSVQSCKFDAETGKVVITLLDGKTLTVDMTTEGYSLLSVMEKDGEYYWGVCENGETT